MSALVCILYIASYITSPAVCHTDVQYKNNSYRKRESILNCSAEQNNKIKRNNRNFLKSSDFIVLHFYQWLYNVSSLQRLVLAPLPRSKARLLHHKLGGIFYVGRSHLLNSSSANWRGSIPTFVVKLKQCPISVQFDSLLSWGHFGTTYKLCQMSGSCSVRHASSLIWLIGLLVVHWTGQMWVA